MRKIINVCGSLLLACSLHAGTIVFDSTSQDSIGSDSVGQVGPLYASFSSDTDAMSSLDGIVLLLQGNSSSSGSISVDLYADSGSNTVGAFVSNLGTVADSSLSSSGNLVSLVVSDFVLDASSRYWIGLTGTNTSADWSWTTDTSGTGVDGESYANMFGTFQNDSNSAYQMELEESMVVSPEPGTLLLCCCGASVAVGARLFRSSSSRPATLTQF